MSIRWKIILIVVPLILATLLLTGVSSYFSASNGITRVAKDFLGFKAQELQNQAESQWRLLVDNNLTGNPQVVMKCGFTEGAKSDGTKVQVPRSISFLGKIYDEGSPLRVALAYEQVSDWHKKNPTLET